MAAKCSGLSAYMIADRQNSVAAVTKFASIKLNTWSGNPQALFAILRDRPWLLTMPIDTAAPVETASHLVAEQASSAALDALYARCILNPSTAADEEKMRLWGRQSNQHRDVAVPRLLAADIPCTHGHGEAWRGRASRISTPSTGALRHRKS